MAEQRARGEARGRLDFLGGIAAEAGALVLSTPTRATTRVEISGRGNGGAATFSCQSERERAAFSVQSTTLRALLALSPSQWRTKFESLKAPAWMLHVWGSFGVFARHTGWWPMEGVHFRVSSDIPWARGLASSAALCMATLGALEQRAELRLSEDEKARWVVEVEQMVVRDFCNLSEPLAGLRGVSGSLLSVLCRPDQVLESLPLPTDTIVVGCPVDAPQEIGSTRGALVRTGALMGRVLLQEKLGARDYASEYLPSQVGDELPVNVLGSDFKERFGGLRASSQIDEKTHYPVRAATRFGIEENFRACLAKSLLQANNAPETLPLIGELLYQSHTAMGAMGLATPSSNALVEALRGRGVGKGIYGARVTGEGTARTVVVLLQQSAHDDLERIRANFSPAGALIE